MWSEQRGGEADARLESRVARLRNAHRAQGGGFLAILATALTAFILWANHFQIDEVARAQGEVIASSRVQVIQAVDGGVLKALNVREGDRVAPGQVLASLDQTRFGASVGEVEARLSALRAKAVRLRAEITGAETLAFPAALAAAYPDTVAVERTLFQQRREGLAAELANLREALALARRELAMIEELYRNGDASGSERLRARRTLNEAESKLITRRNRYQEEARTELTKTEDAIAQNEQTLISRRQEMESSVFVANVPGIVKNIRVTTVGGVLRAGEELMQIVPADDELLLQAKVSPADISRVRPGLEATLRLDTFDYTVFGGVKGRVTYVSADTLKEESGEQVSIYYRVHVEPEDYPVTTTTGRRLDLIPGMTAQVDIRTGERSVMDYLLKPLRRTVTEALGER
ncbi:HlyD family efflux transporter periplasmic adaptor subunit [Halomonas organivorans]